MPTPTSSTGWHGDTSGVPRSDAWCRVGDGDEPALVAVHTWRDERAHYDSLSQALGDHPIYSMFPPQPDAGALPRRVDDWVDHVLTALGDLPVDPPYRLIGWSFGGVVAVETARRLIAGGTPVSFVGMIDSIRPKLRPMSTSEYVWYHLGEALAIPDEGARIRYLGVKGRQLLNRRFPVAGDIAIRALRLARLTRSPDAHRTNRRGNRPTDPLKVSIHVSYLNYRGRGVDFPVSLYGTARSCAQAGAPALRWARWLEAGYDFSIIPGDHHSLFDRGNVEHLAEALQRSLDIAALTARTTRPRR
jgi:thioesterase domain-containing protein